jgi:hypothetical protein
VTRGSPGDLDLDFDLDDDRDLDLHGIERAAP